MKATEAIRRLAASPTGPQTSFSYFDVVRSVFLIASNPGVGRKRLAESLGLGEGAVRTLLSRLKAAGIVRSDRRGCYLTEKARPIYEELASNISIPKLIDVGGTWPFPSNVAIVVKNAAGKVRRGIEQRDSAIRAGAGGAMTLIHRGGRLLMPEACDVTSEYPDFARRVLGQLELGENDVVIIVGANSRVEAENGAIAAALATLGFSNH